MSDDLNDDSIVRCLSGEQVDGANSRMPCSLQSKRLLVRGFLVKIKAIIGSSILLGLMSAGAMAQSLPASCSVTVQNGTGARFYIPNATGVNMLVWGNGTGGGAATYTNLLNAAAARCVLVAAATTANSGGGTEMRDAFNQARQRFAARLRPNFRTCTSGHSQGGGATFNAANVIGSAVTCGIALEPDTVFTVRINRPVAANVDITCIFGNRDTLAPAQPSNLNNCRRNSTIFKTVTVNASHLDWINRAGGGTVGTAQRNEINRLLR